MQTFEKVIEEGGFVEHAKFGGNRYGTSRKMIEEMQGKGKVVVLDIEMEVCANFWSRLMRTFVRWLDAATLLALTDLSAYTRKTDVLPRASNRSTLHHYKHATYSSHHPHQQLRHSRSVYEVVGPKRKTRSRNDLLKLRTRSNTRRHRAFTISSL